MKYIYGILFFIVFITFFLFVNLPLVSDERTACEISSSIEKHIRNIEKKIERKKNEKENKEEDKGSKKKEEKK